MITIFETIDLAAVVACHGRELITEQAHLPAKSIAKIWAASRSRLDAWDYDLGIYDRAAKGGTCELGDRLVRLMLEIHSSEVLTRTLAALFAAHDNFHRRHKATPIGENLLACQRLATRRAIALVGEVNASHEALQTAQSIRRAIAQYTAITDRLLATFAEFADVARFAHEPSALTGTRPPSPFELSLIVKPLATSPSIKGINSELNRSLAEGIIGLFGPELFDTFGTLRATMLQRIDRLTDETEALITSGF